MTKDQIGDKPRPKGSRPYISVIMWDCRDAAWIRDEALYRGITVEQLEKQIFRKLLSESRLERK